MTPSANSFLWSETDGSVPERFALVVERYPDRIAMEDGNQALSYRQLDQHSDLLASTLIACLGSGGEPIAILFEHGMEMIVAALGVIKAGKFYLPLDADQPPDTLRGILADSESRLMIADPAHETLARSIAPGNCAVQRFEDLLDRRRGSDHMDRNGWPQMTFESPAALVYTSGSTGAPKGALRNHRRFLAMAWHHAHHYGIGVDDRVALVFHVASGGSGADIAAALLTGATLCLFDVRRNNIMALVSWLETDAITFLHAPVPLYRELADLLHEAQPWLHLRHVLLAGQTVTVGDVTLFRRCFPAETILVVRLATVEAGPVTHFVIAPDTLLPSEWVPVGYALEGSQILVLDGEGRPVAPGETGEIAVRGLLVSPGYWRRPEETAARFFDDTGRGGRLVLTGDLGRMHANGLLEHLGRNDHMVKIRGYRVELGAVEAALRALPAVGEAAVLVQTMPMSEQRLVAFVGVRDGLQVTAPELRRSLAAVLPEYMLPSVCVPLATLPLTSSGKIDRRWLQEQANLLPPIRPRPNLETPYVAPTSATETEMVAIWADVLGYDLVGIHDRFLDLGGNSILAARILARVIRAFAVDIPLQALLETPTAVALSALVDERLANMGNNGDIRQLLAAIEALSDSEAKSLLEGAPT